MAENKAAEIEKPKPGHTFTHKGKQYKTILGAVIIPGQNENQPVTSLEISTNEDLQNALLSINGVVGSVVEEVFTETPAAE
jgi:hypothetical protein